MTNTSKPWGEVNKCVDRRPSKPEFAKRKEARAIRTKMKNKKGAEKRTEGILRRISFNLPRIY